MGIMFTIMKILKSSQGGLTRIENLGNTNVGLIVVFTSISPCKDLFPSSGEPSNDGQKAALPELSLK